MALSPRWSDLYVGDMLCRKESDDLYILERRIQMSDEKGPFSVYVFAVNNHREIVTIAADHLDMAIQTRGYYLAESNNFF